MYRYISNFKYASSFTAPSSTPQINRIAYVYLQIKKPRLHMNH